jgi:hypothetical protein
MEWIPWSSDINQAVFERSREDLVSVIQAVLLGKVKNRIVAGRARWRRIQRIPLTSQMDVMEAFCNECFHSPPLDC